MSCAIERAVLDDLVDLRAGARVRLIVERPSDAVASSLALPRLNVAPLWLMFSSPSISASISANSKLLPMYGRYFA